MTQKTCTSCGETKPVSEFYSAPTKEGFRSRCKTCFGKETLARQRRNPEKAKQYRTKYAQSTKGRETLRKKWKRRAAKPARRKWAKDYRKKNRKRETARMRTYNRKKIYNISDEEYDRLFKEQNGLCKICGGVPRTRTLGVDHDHETGEVRGLLCMSCNVGLGQFKDNPDLLRSAAAYLEPKPNLVVLPDLEVESSESN